MKRVYLARHGKADDFDPHVHSSDVDRALTSKGREELAVIGKSLRRIDSHIEIVYSSPLKRARQTAEILADALGVKTEVLQDLTPPVSPPRLLRAARALPQERFVLVGHEPGMGDCLGRWISDLPLSIPFKKGAIARIDVPASASSGPAMLVWHATPELMGVDS